MLTIQIITDAERHEVEYGGPEDCAADAALLGALDAGSVTAHVLVGGKRTTARPLSSSGDMIEALRRVALMWGSR